MILFVKEESQVEKSLKNYRFKLEKFQIRLIQDSIFYTYFVTDSFYGTRHHFFIYKTPEYIILKNYPLSLHNQTALQELCEQITDLSSFYDSISKYHAKIDDYATLSSDMSFYILKEDQKKLTRFH